MGRLLLLLLLLLALAVATARAEPWRGYRSAAPATTPVYRPPGPSTTASYRPPGSSTTASYRPPGSSTTASYRPPGSAKPSPRPAVEVSTSSTAAPADSVRRERPGEPHRRPAGHKPAPGGVKLPTATLTKPTKYHYYPHNQHIYLLPECAVQQVCNAVYVRLNFTQPLCACPARYRDPCSASLDADDQHTTELVTDPGGKALTLVKTCEPAADMRVCRAPRDWSLLALQNIRTGKSHYLVICRCPGDSILEGPTPHDQPTYASVPGIRVFGMTCVQPVPGHRRARPLRLRQRRAASSQYGRQPFPWARVRALAEEIQWEED